MKLIGRVFLAVLLIAAVRPAPATAQLGSLIDKIQEMSGPEMFYLGPTFRWGYQPGQAVDAAGLGEIREALSPLVGAPQAVPRGERGILEGRVELAEWCLEETGELIEELTSQDGFYDERSIDRYRENRRRLQWLARVILDSTENREVRAESVAPLFADLACRQPGLLARALEKPDPMRGWVGRFGLYSGTDTRLDRPLEVDVRGLMAQLSAEYLFALPMRQGVNVGLEAGLSVHYFYGDIDHFVHPTFPIRLNVHPFARCRSWVTRNIRFGGGIDVIPPFRSGAFDGIYPLDDGWEVVPFNFFVAWDYSIGSGPSGGGTC